jgi:ATP-dependent helicase/nuclease subunit B
VPNCHFLTASEPLSQQVAGFLSVADAESALLITPTAGAARRITKLVAATGAKPPQTAQPMQALLPDQQGIASPVERCLAWAEALRAASSSQRQTLFWNRAPETSAELLKGGRNFNRLCDRLAEAGLSPETLQLPTEAGSFDEGRWSAIAALYRWYLDCLSNWSLHDPNALRLKQIKEPATGISRLIIACVADLPRAFERYATQLESKGATIDILIWNPANVGEASFDNWGRPLAEFWSEKTLPIDQGQIYVAASAQDEARVSIQPLLQDSASIVVADPKFQSLLACEIISQGRKPYLPEGKNLIHCEAAKLAIEWEAFRQSKDLRRLRRLVELPAFCRALDIENPISQTDALVAIDHLLGKTISSTLDTAWAASPALPENSDSRSIRLRAKIRRLLGSVRSRLNTSALDLIEATFPETDSKRPETIQRVLEIGRELEASPALRNWPKSKSSGSLPSQIFTQAIRNEQIQIAAAKDDITLNGWLEAPWLPESQLVLCGLIEGKLPTSLDGDPFLPDSVCPALGLSNNTQRLTRDTYLLDALLASRPSGQIQLSFSKYNTEGDPNRPSRLLLRTELGELPARVQHITQARITDRKRPTRQTNWRWRLPCEIPAVEKISPTQFESYLACPFRFCLEKVLRLDRGAQAAHEMDAAVFGNLIHKTLEKFGLEIIPSGQKMLSLDEATIRKRVQQLLQEESLLQFGPQPAPAVQIQLANAAARLYAFARVQATCFEAGWMILDVERALDAESDQALKIGSLKLSGIIDRIEQHVASGALRVMDYKTFSALKKPKDTHFAPGSHNWLPAAQIELTTGTRSAQKTWKNLQLPLYRKILEHWYPKECANQTPEVAYFILPSDPNESGIYTFEELNQPEVYQAALACAEAVAEQISDGAYWPPQPFRGTWGDPFAPIFMNGSPEDCIAPETIAQLKGGQP